MTLINPVSRDELRIFYDQSDFLFLHLNDYQAFRKVLPSKIFELATFNGESDTTGQGKVIDFNIIFKPSISPKVTIIELNNQEEYQFELNKGLVYCVNGRVEIAGKIVLEKNAYFGTDICQIVKTEQSTLLIVVTW